MIEEKAEQIFDIIMKLDGDKGDIAYAQSYAQAGYGMTGKTLAVQILYVLCNLQQWKGEEARNAKLELKQIARSMKG